MIIRTSQEAALVTCCGCPPPACGEPRINCESLSHTSTCADDDYTDAMAIWEAKVAAYEDWEDAHAAFPALHAAWVTDHADWVDDQADWEACEIATPGECGAEPVEPIEPVDPEEPEEPGLEPEIPEGYNDVTHGCYAPFAEPAGDPGDEIPTLYRTLRDNGSNTYSGIGWAYYSGAGTGGLSAEFLTVATFTNSDGFTGVYVDSGNTHDDDLDTCEAHTPTGDNNTPNFEFPNNDEMYAMGSTDPICLANQRGTETIGTWTSNPTPRELVGCPGPFGEDADAGWDYTRKLVTGDLLESGISKADLMARAIANLPTVWVGAGSTCAASMVVVWPVTSDLYIGADPEADPPVAAAWPACDSLTDLPHGFPATATATKYRYEVGIPEEWADFDGRHATWVTEHADWEACEIVTPGECGAEPVEPTERTVFDAQWDEGFFSKIWTNWRALKDAFDEATALREAWLLADPETRGPEPIVPADPGAEPPRPSLVASRSWSYAGAGEFSEKFEVDAPSEPGEIRIVNMMTKCHHDTKRGVKPTAHGEVFEFDEP